MMRITLYNWKDAGKRIVSNAVSRVLEARMTEQARERIARARR